MHLNRRIAGIVRHLPVRALSRRLGVGLMFYFLGLAILYALIELSKTPLLLSTLLTAEATTIVRYAVNDLWVFGEKRLSWTRLWQFHVANAGGFAVWWIMVNALPPLGVHYLLASTLGTASSMVSTMATKLQWIWLKRTNALPGGGQSVGTVIEVSNGR